MLVVFPARHRIGFIRRHASRMSTLSEHGATRYLKRQLRIQAETLVRRGIAAEVVANEVQQLETAIRHELARMTALGVA
jgi:hypothetical protein